MGPFIYQSRKNGSVIYSFLGKRGLIVYLAALKKGAIRAAHPYHVIYRELPPPPWLMTASSVPSYRGYALVLHVRYWKECKADTTDSSHYLA